VVRLRLVELTDAFVGGASEGTLQRRFAARWKCSRRNVRRYIRAMRRELYAASVAGEKPQSRQVKRERTLRKLWDVAERAKDLGDLKAEISAIESTIRLDQLQERSDAELRHQGNGPRPLQDMAPVELRERARGLRRVGAG
jgi:hypothetical protein